MDEHRQKAYNVLYGESYLLNLGIEFKFLDKLENLFVIKKERSFLFRKDYAVQAQCIIDISEKIGFLHLALDYIRQLEGKQYSTRLTKYHFYNFVYDCKACLDSIAVLLNHQLRLGFRGGKRDFRFDNFRRKLEKGKFFQDFSSRFGHWCDEIIEYRKRIIHQIGVPVFQVGAGHPDETWKPSLPLCIPKEAISSIDIALGKKFEPIQITTFCQDSIKKIMDIAEITLREIHENIRVSGKGF